MNKKIMKLIDQYEKEAITLRHHLHENPELSTKEFETSALMKSYAKELDLTIEEIPADKRSSGTGFIAILDTGRKGKTIALRTELDALPIKERAKNLAGRRTVRSKNEGVMHACGHDGHMATLISVMKILDDLKEDLTGKIIFIFEEAEEIGAGIHGMIQHLQTKKIDAIYGNHLAAFLETGKIAVDPGPVMAAAAAIDLTIIGKGGHGSRPDLSVNPLIAGVDIINSLSLAWNNQLDVSETVTFGFTQFHVGEQNNVFADEATLGGTIRYFNIETGQKAYEMIVDIAKKVGAVHQTQIEVGEFSGPATLPTINDERLAAKVQSGINDLFPHALEKDVTWYASESFAYYSKIAPTIFSFIGIKNEELGSGAEHHNEYFDMDDGALRYSIGAMVKFAVDYLKSN